MATTRDDERRRLPGLFDVGATGEPSVFARRVIDPMATYFADAAAAARGQGEFEQLRSARAPAAPQPAPTVASARPPAGSISGGVAEQIPTAPAVPQIGAEPAFRRSAFGPAIQNQGQTAGDQLADMGYATRPVQGAPGVSKVTGNGRTIYTDSQANTADWIGGGMRPGVNTIPASRPAAGGGQRMDAPVADPVLARPQCPAGGIIGNGDVARREREALVRAASTPYRGAQNGQLTANQLRILAGLQEGDQRAATEAANQQAATQRAEIQESGQNARFAAQYGLDSRRVGADVQRAQGELEQQGRIRTLQDRLIAEQDPAKRAQFERTLGIISGRGADTSGRDRFMTVQGGQVSTPDGMGVMTAPSRVFDTQTQQYIDAQPVAGGNGRAAPSYEQFKAQIRAKNPGATVDDRTLSEAYMRQFGQ